LEGLVTKIHKRHQFLKRPPIANVSRVFFINSICEPPLDFEAIDRFLFSAEVHKLTSVLLFNKVDILDKQGWEQLEKTMEIYHRIGYQTLPVSVHEGTGIDSVIDLTKDTISTLAGLSGVGKSSLLAKIFPDKDFRIGSLSESTGKGMHTTTHITLHRLGNGGYIADTPGFAFVRLPFIDEDDVVVCFPEIAAQAGNCRFNNCIHENEPGCRVREMVEMGEIAESRWQHYLKIYKEMREWRQQYR
jgi:ribosome biogenesis GTPase / thiamine phosphate phosphatase